MSKGNLFLGFGRGKVGDVVFFRQYGEQITRARNRAPKNPQTALQLLQRVILKTVSSAYSLFQPLANHSFQGEQEGTANQSMFTRRNVEILRNRLESIIYDGDPSDILSSTEANFSRKASSGAEINAYLISEGSIASMEVSFINGGPSLRMGDFSAAPSYSTLTYQQVVNALGLQRGDQLTFVWLGCDDSGDEGECTFRAFDFARVILEPANGDMTTLFTTNTGTINSPNVRNEGTVVLGISGTGPYYLTFASGVVPSSVGRTNSLCAATVIASRLNGGVWERSTQRLVLRPAGTGAAGALTYENEIDLLGDAVLSYMSGENSSLYLNQSRSFSPAGATAGKIWLNRLPSLDPASPSDGIYIVNGEVTGGGYTLRNPLVRILNSGTNIQFVGPDGDLAFAFSTDRNSFVSAAFGSTSGIMPALLEATGLSVLTPMSIDVVGNITKQDVSGKLATT